MGRTSVSLSLDSETLKIWNLIPLKKRSAQVREHLRALSNEGAFPMSFSVLDPKRVLKNEKPRFQSVRELLGNLTELPKEPAKKPVSQERERESTEVYDLSDTIDLDE